ncbi:E family protein [Staphylococcus aureus]|uniref:E family protein n=1 Tax=Staphylococcus aureus TaxID=1280 RepID=A0A380ECN5_STAAU|nr:E family protein [Staphylococcus aureus]
MTVNPERVEVNWSKLTKEEIDQIWAEAKYYYEQGEELFLNPD